MKGPVTLSLGMRAELLPTDVSPVPSHYILHSDAPVHENMRLVPSHVKLKGGVETLPGGARYEFCLATQIKPAVYMLPDWLDYHRRIGIDMVYIFDNGASEDLNGMFANRTDVEVLFWPFARSQLQAFSYAMISLRTRCEWVLLLDSDEYLMLGLDTNTVSDKVIGFRPLKKHVGDLRDAGFQRVSFNWLVMKNSDFVNRPPVPAPLAYVHREEPQVARLWKTMASTDVNWTGSTPHTRVTDELVRTYSKKWVSMTPTDVADVGIVVHFRKRSWEEYSEKVLAGRGNIQNPRSLESIQKMRELGKDRNQERYMRLGLKNRAEYTFFRSVWKRVKKGFSNSEVVVARWRRDGVRCRALFNVGEGGVGDTRFIAETCSPPRSTPSE